MPLHSNTVLLLCLFCLFTLLRARSAASLRRRRRRRTQTRAQRFVCRAKAGHAARACAGRRLGGALCRSRTRARRRRDGRAPRHRRGERALRDAREESRHTGMVQRRLLFSRFGIIFLWSYSNQMLCSLAIATIHSFSCIFMSTDAFRVPTAPTARPSLSNAPSSWRPRVRPSCAIQTSDAATSSPNWRRCAPPRRHCRLARPPLLPPPPPLPLTQRPRPSSSSSPPHCKRSAMRSKSSARPVPRARPR